MGNHTDNFNLNNQNLNFEQIIITFTVSPSQLMNYDDHYDYHNHNEYDNYNDLIMITSKLI